MPGIPENITIAGRTPATIKGNLPPLINTAPAARGGFRAGDDTGGDNPVGVIFSEDFDNQPDFHNLMHSTTSSRSAADGDILPEGFDFLYQEDQWAPENGDLDSKHSLEILASNVDKTRNGTGKSVVFNRESYGSSIPESGDVVQAGSWIRIFHTAADTNNTTKTSTVTANGQTYTFSSTTAVTGDGVVRPVATPNSTQFSDVTDAALGRSLRSNPLQITVTGPVTLDYGSFETSPSGTGSWSGWNNWASDAQFLKVLPQGYDELYVEFWVRFSPNWFQRNATASWTSKMFRIGSWSRQGIIYNGFGGGDPQVGPRFIWGYKRDSYGVRNVLSFLEGPNGSQGAVKDGSKGSRNYKGHTAGMAKDGGNPQIPNLIDGGFIYDTNGPITHEQLYGTTETWTKLGFYVKLNSAPGVADGVLRQWINDEQFNNDQGISWIGANPEGEMSQWNYIGIGGNDWFKEFPNFDKFEDWWALDDLIIRDSIPQELI